MEKLSLPTRAEPAAFSVSQSLSVVSLEVAGRRVSLLMARALTAPLWACQLSSGSAVQVVVSKTRTRPSSLPQ